MRRADQIFAGFLCLIVVAVVLLIGIQIGIVKGRTLGYEEANVQNQDMAFARALAVVDQDLEAELETCKTWVDGLGADLMEANSIIRGGR